MDAVNLGGPGGSRWGMAGLVGPGGRLGLPAGRGRVGGGVAGRVAGRVGQGVGGMAGQMGPGCREKLSLGREKMIWGRENSEKCKNCREKKYNGGVGGLGGAQQQLSLILAQAFLFGGSILLVQLLQQCSDCS